MVSLKNQKFTVELLSDAVKFIEQQEEKARKKIIYNMTKAQFSNDPTLFKKLNGQIWEFRTLYNKNYYRIFSFWYETKSTLPVVISTHGVIKKSKKVEKHDLERAISIKNQFLNQKN